MNSGAEGAEKKIFLSMEMVFFFSTQCIANDDFCEPPRRADSKNPIFTFCRILGAGHLRGSGVSRGRILGGPPIGPSFFWVVGGASSRAVSTLKPCPPLRIAQGAPDEELPTYTQAPEGFTVLSEQIFDVPTEHGLLLENLLDLAHAPFTHTSTFAKGWPIPGSVKFRTTDLLAGNWDPYPIDMAFAPPCGACCLMPVRPWIPPAQPQPPGTGPGAFVD